MPAVQLPKEHPAITEAITKMAQSLCEGVGVVVCSPQDVHQVLLRVWAETSVVLTGDAARRVFMEAIGIAREKAGIPYRAADDPRLD